MRTIKSKILACIIVVFFSFMLISCDEDEIVTAAFSVSETDIETGETVTFNNESENAQYYQWDFGDGDVSVDENPTHEYSVAGTYEVTLVAIGNDGADSATVSLDVEAGYDVTILEGEGIENVELYDTWAEIQSVYTSTDTVHYIYDDYLEDYGFYYHEIYFYEEGVVFDFLTESTTLSDTDPVYYIWVLDPFSGATKKGISIGSDAEDVIEFYGDPETEYEGDGYTSYWYDTQGIDFYYSNSYGVVDEICIYEPYESSSLSTKSAERKVIMEKIQNHLIRKKKF